MNNIQEKTCSGPCGLVKPVSEFNVKKDRPSGYQSYCRICSNRANAKHYKANKEKLDARHAQYNQDNKERLAIKKAIYWKANKERYSIIKAKWRQDNKERIAQRSAQYRHKNKDAISARKSKYRKANKDQIAIKNAQWRRENSDKVASYFAKYRAAKLQRTVIWADLDKIKQVYTDCMEINLAAKTAGCTEKFVVDHIIPLQGKLVSGLHVHTNLQIITVTNNSSKNNNFIPGSLS